MKKIIILYYLIFSTTIFPFCYQLTIPRYDNGFFSIFFSVIGALDYYDRSAKDCTGISVEFGNQGLYYDRSHGLNWWNYYFEPIHFGDQNNKRTIDLNQFSTFALEALYIMPYERCHELIKKYVRIKPHIEQKVNDYLHQNFKHHSVIGVHYRGTDKALEAALLSYDKVINEIKKEIEKNPRAKIFVATDEDKFLKAMHTNFPGRILSIDAIRSTNGRPVHYSFGAKYQKGEDALIDAILLSHCYILYRTTSNLSAASVRFNPAIEEIMLSKNHHEINKETSLNKQ